MWGPFKVPETLAVLFGVPGVAGVTRIVTVTGAPLVTVPKEHVTVPAKVLYLALASASLTSLRPVAYPTRSSLVQDDRFCS